MASRLRFGIALALATALGIVLVWTALGGALETYSGPGELEAGTTYRLNGEVAPGAPVDAAERAASSEGLRFQLIDKENAGQRVEVLYRGSIPDTFKVGREVVITGELGADGVFVAERNTLVTFCPSKFDDAPGDQKGELDIPEISPAS